VSAATYLAELTREELRNLATKATLILPTAAIEQHGPHLPLVTDTLIAERLSAAVAEAAAERATTCVAPVVGYGSSHHHRVFGAMSLGTHSFYAVVVDLLTSACQIGFRKIFVLNAHGGNDDVIRLAARDVAEQFEVDIAANSYWNLAMSELRADWGDVPLPGHAGLFETSLMLALAPHLVRSDLVPRDSQHPLAVWNQRIIPGSIARHGEWKRIDGYTDPADQASAELGRRLFDTVVAAVSAALIAFHGSTPPDLEEKRA